MKEARTFLGALMWAGAGAAIAALLFLTHYFIAHDSAAEVDNHAYSEARS
jgi:hypothetical protein